MSEKKLPAGFRRCKDGVIERRFSVDGKRYSVYSSTVTGCREKETALRDVIAKGMYTKNRDITVSEYFEEFLDAKSGSVKASTIIHNRSTFARVLKEFGSKKVRSLEARQIKAFRKQLEEEIMNDGSKLTTHGGNDILELLVAVLETAVNDAIISRNPAAGIKKFKRIEADVRDTIHRKLTAEELERFFKQAAGSYYIHLFEFLISTGCRVGEAAALYWTDIDNGKDTISIQRSVTKKQGGGVEIGDSAKTAAGRRTIHTNEEIRRILQAQKSIVESLFGTQTVGLVFPSARGGITRPSSVDTILKGICKKADIDHFSAHAFRHTFASNMVDAGVAPEVLKSILGHTNIKVTLDTYYHSNDDRVREAMENNVISYRAAV